MFPPHMDQLPDNILLEILGYLKVKELCISGRVCRRWRRIARDNSLWRHVDLLPYRLVPNRIWKVIRTHLSECLLTLRIKGFVDGRNPKQIKHSVTNAMLQDIKERCPNIKMLHLHQCDVETLDASLLPETLISLTLTSSNWKPRWLKTAPPLKLDTLNLNDSVRVDNFDMEDIVKWVDLQTLNLGNCYRVTDTGFQKMATVLVQLNDLDLSGTQVTDLALHHISRHLKNLKRIVLQRCSKITDSGLTTLVLGLNKLESLDVSKCTQLTKDGIVHCKNNKSLKTLICSINVELPNCEVVQKNEG